METLKLLRSLFIEVIKKLYLLIPSLLTDPWDIMERWFKFSPWIKVRNEQYQIITFWIILVAGFIIALIWAYVELKNKLHFEFSGNSITTKDNRLILGVIFSSSAKMVINNLSLEYNGKKFCPLDWKPFKLNRLHNQNYTFDLSKIRAESSVGNKKAKVLVSTDKTKYESPLFNIFPLL